MEPFDGGGTPPVTADGRELKMYGQRRVWYELPNGDIMESTFLILDVEKVSAEEISVKPWMLYEWACEGNSRLAR
eukprot:503201-Heterocapsa_arctica.AAC.1